jgi:hypothetical protein
VIAVLSLPLPCRTVGQHVVGPQHDRRRRRQRPSAQPSPRPVTSRASRRHGPVQDPRRVWGGARSGQAHDAPGRRPGVGPGRQHCLREQQRGMASHLGRQQWCKERQYQDDCFGQGRHGTSSLERMSCGCVQRAYRPSSPCLFNMAQVQSKRLIERILLKIIQVWFCRKILT